KDSRPSWTSIKSRASTNISAIAVAKRNSNIIWVGHNNGEIYYTTDGGTNWTRDNLGLPGRFCTRLTIDPQNSNLVYATFGGFNSGNVWKTSDYGTRWTNISHGLP